MQRPGLTSRHNVGNLSSRKNSNSHIDASHSRQPLVKGERLVRYEVNAVIVHIARRRVRCLHGCARHWGPGVGALSIREQGLQMGGCARTPACAAMAHKRQCVVNVTPKGVLPPALCHASATLESA